jgi:hypothetical protein
VPGRSSIAGDKPAASQLEHWASLTATIAAPVTVLGALLFYFGYVSSAAEYAYFGINVDTIGLGTRDYVMRSPQTLLVPLLVLTLASAGFLMLNVVVRRRIAWAAAQASGPAAPVGPPEPDADPAREIEHIRQLLRASRITGLAVLTGGVVLLFAYPYIRGWAFYGLVTPLMIASGAAIIAYAAHAQTLVHRLPPAPARPARDQADGPVLARRTAGVLIYVVIAASIFWATATVAQWSGRGLAQYDATHFGELPSVILDSRERLFLRDPWIEETQLPPSPGQTFHYRYRGLHLLIEGQDRMFLVPGSWSASDSTLIVPLDGSVRVQFQFQDQPP